MSNHKQSEQLEEQPEWRRAIEQFSKMFPSSEVQFENLHSSINSLMTRLDELNGTLKMSQVNHEGRSSRLMAINQLEDSLRALSRRIDAMEVFISRVTSDLGKIEAYVENAEDHYRNTTSAAIHMLLKPILSVARKSSDSRNLALVYGKPLTTFSTDELFGKNGENLGK